MAVGIAARSEWAKKAVPARSLIKAATSLSSLLTILMVMSLPEWYWKTGLDGSVALAQVKKSTGSKIGSVCLWRVTT